MPYVTVNDLRLYYEFTGPEDRPLILQFGGSLFGRQNFAMVNDGFRESFRLLSLRRLGLRALRLPDRELLGRGLGRRGRRPARRARDREGVRPRHLDGRDGRDRVHREVPGADDRRLRRLRNGPV